MQELSSIWHGPTSTPASVQPTIEPFSNYCLMFPSIKKLRAASASTIAPSRGKRGNKRAREGGEEGRVVRISLSPASMVQMVVDPSFGLGRRANEITISKTKSAPKVLRNRNRVRHTRKACVLVCRPCRHAVGCLQAHFFIFTLQVPTDKAPTHADRPSDQRRGTLGMIVVINIASYASPRPTDANGFSRPTVRSRDADSSR